MRILGIDMGSASIKAVELDSAFGRYEIHDYHEISRAPGTSPAEAIQRLMGSLAKKPDRIAVAIRTNQVTFRNLNLPTRDKKAIQSGVAFELEDELPFALDDSTYDYSILSQGKQGSYLHVAATLKKHVAALLTTWQNAGIDPDLVTTESWAYRTLLNRVLGQNEADPGRDVSPALVVQIGHERTTLYLHWRGTPVFARELPWGGRDLSTAICQKYQIPLEQAEAAKLDHGFVVPATQKVDVTPEQLEFSQTLMEPIQALITAIRQGEFSCKSMTQKNIGMIYLSGGTSLLPGLAKVLEENLSVPVRPLQALSSIATSGVTYSDQTDAGFLLAASLALCLVGSDRASGINFRKGEFAKIGQARELNMETLKKPLLALGAITACFGLSLAVQSSTYKSKLAETDTQLEKSVRSFFGSLSTSAVKTYMSNTSSLRTSINKELTKQRELAKLVGPNPHSPTDFLRELSASVPKDVVVDMTQYQVGAAPGAPFSPAEEGSASLSFLVSNPAMAERLSGVLSGKLGGLQKGKMEEVSLPDGTKKWKVTFTGKPTGESYGK